MNRPMTEAERRLVRWMLTNGAPEDQAFLPQLEQIEVTPWACQCGCASIEFALRGTPAAKGFQPLTQFLFGPEDDLNGIFIYKAGLVLGGLEVSGFGHAAPKSL